MREFAFNETPQGDQAGFEPARGGMEPASCERQAGRGNNVAPALATLPHYASPVGGPMGCPVSRRRGAIFGLFVDAAAWKDTPKSRQQSPGNCNARATAAAMPRRTEPGAGTKPGLHHQAFQAVSPALRNGRRFNASGSSVRGVFSCGVRVRFHGTNYGSAHAKAPESQRNRGFTG